jgi:hypothetical protein
VTDAGKTFEIRRIKPEKRWIIRRFDYQRIFEINHGTSPHYRFKPAAFRITLQVPVGISLAP